MSGRVTIREMGRISFLCPGGRPRCSRSFCAVSCFSSSADTRHTPREDNQVRMWAALSGAVNHDLFLNSTAMRTSSRSILLQCSTYSRFCCVGMKLSWNWNMTQPMRPALMTGSRAAWNTCQASFSPASPSCCREITGGGCCCCRCPGSSCRTSAGNVLSAALWWVNSPKALKWNTKPAGVCAAHLRVLPGLGMAYVEESTSTQGKRVE
mmetsp:Transcript_24322/g.53145  ORF Transcript_24322/g.53145 Transcript_24322/m.53145 type:complete len:209 (+) Transcript_24322:1035-1661(+)